MSAPNKQNNFQSLMDYEEYLVGSEPLVRDYVNTSTPSIDVVHREVHLGKHFTYSHEGTIASGTVGLIILTVRPAIGTELHFTAVVSAKNSGWARLYEDATVVGGTIVTPKNNKRTSDTTMSGTLTLGGTITDYGVRLQSRAVGSSSPGVRLGGEGATRAEWILDEDYVYLMTFTADNADTQVSFDFEAYEVTT